MNIMDEYSQHDYYTLGNGYLAIKNIVNMSIRGVDNHTASKPSYTSEHAAEQITRTGKTWNGDHVYQQPATLTYSFLQNAAVTPAGDRGGFGFTAVQMEYAKRAMALWAEVANVIFHEVDNDAGANITFGNYTLDYYGNSAWSQAYAYLPGDYAAAGSTWYNYNQDSVRYPDKHEYGQQTLNHEVGHALGLSHPGNYNAGNGSPTYQDAVYLEDSRQYSIMSYWSEYQTGGDNQGHYATGLLMDDIAAIQRLYGENNTTRTGDTVYGFNANAGYDYLSITDPASTVRFCVWDAGGRDTLDFSGYLQDQRINLTAGTFSDVGGGRGNVSIAQGVTIENAIGGHGNDILIGNDTHNQLTAGAGNDILYGGKGVDWLWGGEGKDIFVFSAAADSDPAHPDWIFDFNKDEDTIDLSGFRAEGGTPLHLVDILTGQAGEVWVGYDPQTQLTDLAINAQGNNGYYDFQVKIIGQVVPEVNLIV
ncbi:serralysin family metalloprotease [Serratia ureilytica]|uniref:serralysin family metalloprotease n=1 Tax=Serratia ureilytica TaxID=300181 RepID=UPI003863CFF4